MSDVVEFWPRQSQQNSIKILFYNSTPRLGKDSMYLGLAALQLKTFVDITDPQLAKKLHWAIPIQESLPDAELLLAIQTCQPDVLCTSHYIWNHQNIMSQLARIKPKLDPKIKIITGGPSIDVKTNKDFFTQYWFVDYAVYGSGENAFLKIVKSLADSTEIDVSAMTNCAWKDVNTGNTVIANFEYVKMLQVSPFVVNQDFFSDIVNESRINGINDPIVSYELTRGCPYACTFCDWNSGLSNKVTRRKNTYEAEIDLFEKLKIKTVYLSDANVGQYPEDVDMVEYFAQKNLRHGADFHLYGNYSKLKKDVNLKIYHILAQGKLVRTNFNFSVQDVNKTVLENIERPDVGWDVHAAMIKELTSAYPHLHAAVQLIYGLPGQTPQTWRDTLRTVTSLKTFPQIMLNEPLPASPAMYDPEYQNQFQFEYIVSKRLSARDKIDMFLSTIPKKCVSFGQQELVEIAVLSNIYSVVSTIRLAVIDFYQDTWFDIESVVNAYVESENYKMLKQNLWNNWSQENKFYYTKNFDGTPKLYSACYQAKIMITWVQCQEFIEFVMNSTDPDIANKIHHLWITNKIFEMVNWINNEHS